MFIALVDWYMYEVYLEKIKAQVFNLPPFKVSKKRKKAANWPFNKTCICVFSPYKPHISVYMCNKCT